MRARLRQILLAKSVISGREFVLASGKTSTFYCDARLTTLDPEGACLCARIFLEMLAPYPAAAVGGYAIGADPIVSAIAVLSFLADRPLPAFLIRKEEKNHGLGKLIEGNFPSGGPVVLFDDVVTSGGSILKGCRVVEGLGGKVLAVMALLDREEGGRELIEKAGYPFAAIFRKTDLT